MEVARESAHALRYSPTPVHTEATLSELNEFDGYECMKHGGQGDAGDRGGAERERNVDFYACIHFSKIKI